MILFLNKCTKCFDKIHELKKKPVFEKVLSILKRFSFIVQNITARDPHTRLKTFKQILAVFYDFFKAAISKFNGYYLPNFEIVVRQFLLIKIYT